MKNKVILNLTAIDYSGAGKFTTNFNEILLAYGYESYLVVKDTKSDYSKSIKYPSSKLDSFGPKLARRVSKWSWSRVSLDYDYYFYNIYEQYTTVSAKTILSLIPYKPDIIFIHWVTDFINAKIIKELYDLTGAKMMWLMTDNAPLTGGCHYPWTCTKYYSTCDECPAIFDNKKKQQAKANLAFKKKYLPKDLTLLVFSQNDLERAQRSVLFHDKPIVRMPGYFVDEKKFCPGNRAAAKASFGIPGHHQVVFFGATSLNEKRKGMHLFIEAIKLLELKDVTLLIAGTSSLSYQTENMRFVGNLNEEDLVRAYQASNVFACPTLEDSGPTMINQAVMCGTPVVSFNAGLGRDLVHTGKTGYKAVMGSYTDLSKGIQYILGLSPDDASVMSGNCREYAIELYGGQDEYRKNIADLIYN